MKKMYLALLALGFATGAFAQTDAEMRAWKDYMTPGEVHKMMAAEEGVWDCEMTFWMEPGGKPEKYTSTAHVKMIMGGRYQETIYKGEMMGMPFEGKAITGYNNASKEFTNVFVDNMGTGTMVSIGKYDPATKTIKSKGEMVNPMDGKKVAFRENYIIIDNNTRKIEMYDTKNGKEFKSMEIIMTRN